MELLPLKAFVDSINAIHPGSATVSGMKRRAEQGRLPAQKNGRAWMVITDSAEAQAFVNQARAKAEAHGEVSRIAGLEMNLQTAHEVNQDLNRRLEVVLEANKSLRSQIVELERQLEVAEAKLEIALQFSGVSGVKPKVRVKRTPGKKNNTTEVNWSNRYEEWAQHQTRPTITAFAKEVGVPRTTINAALLRAKRNEG